MADWQGALDAGTEAAWTDYRRGLADRLAGLTDGDATEIGVAGAARAVTVECHDGRLESRVDDERLADVEPRQADLLAVLVVEQLRERLGAIHPSFLLVDGAVVSAPAPERLPEPDEQVATFPDSAAHLQSLVDRALAVLLDCSPRHDPDGDVPIIVGRSVVHVRVAQDLPAVDLYAEVVLDVHDTDRIAVELDVLNGREGTVRFHSRDDVVVMTHRLHAWPFAPDQLRLVLARVCDDLDEIADGLARRLGGRRYLDTSPAASGPDPDDTHPAMVGLLELLHDGPVDVPALAALFDHDRHELIRQCVRIRTGRQPCAGHDEELVLSHLRAALRHVAEVKAVLTQRRTPARPAPRSHQPSLLDDPAPSDEGVLDLGAWTG